MHRYLTAALALLAAGCTTMPELPQAPIFPETEQLREACPAERAIYSIADSTAVLRIVKTPHSVNAQSDLAVRVDANGHTFWFGFLQSNGYGRLFLSYIEDPLAPNAEDPLETPNAPSDNDLVLLDSQLKATAIPSSGDEAPAYLVAPGIGVRFWYDLTDRTPVPVGMWRRTACAPA